MKPKKHLRPLSSSLSRFKSLVGLAAALGFATNAQVSGADVAFQGNTGPTPGDGVSWLDPRNWQDDLIPGPFDNLTFGTGITGPIQLGGAQAANTLTFDASHTLGAYGTELTFDNQGGTVTVSPGVTATINAAYTSLSGLTLSGGGALFLNNPTPTFAGNIIVDGVGTTLLHRGEGPTVQYNGVGGAQEFGRHDQVTLGLNPAVKTITLQNGGTYRLFGAGGNPEANYKNIVIGQGGGTFDLAAGYLVHNVDDVGQITTTNEAFTKAGKGRLIITGAMADVNPLAGTVNINGGMISLDRLQGAGGAGTRFAGIAATAFVNVNNGGTLFMNNGTAGVMDVAFVNLNEGGTIAFNGNVTHVLGLNAGGTTLNVTGTGNILFRELFGPQNERLYRIRTDITGSGTIVAIPNTNSGGNPRMVIERNTSNDFTGVFRLPENMALEGNPRNMPTANVGKVIGQGDVDFAGWASRLDVRDSTAGAVELDYRSNDLMITSPQAGSIARIAVLRGDTAAGTGHLFNFGLLSMSNQRLAIEGNNSHQVGISETATISGNALIEMRTDNSHLVFSDLVSAITEDAAGRKLTLVKTGPGNAAARDVIVGGPISMSNLEVSTGTLQLRGVAGAIGAGFGGAAPTVIVNGGANNFTNGLPTQGVLHLDSNTGHVVGASTIIAPGQNLDRIVDTATVEMRSNSILRLTSQLDAGTTEVIGTTNVGGHATFDVVKTGTSATPVALTLNTFNLTGLKATANFTGTSLGVAGTNSSRIIINPTTAATGFLGAQFHSGNEWAKYDNTVESGFQLGVTPFAAGDYTIDGTATDAAWAAGQQLKLNGATGAVMSANRNVARLNTQFTAANQAVDLAGFALTLDEGGLLVSGQLTGIVDGVTGTAPSGTAGITSGTGTFYAHNNAQLDIRAPITGAIDFVKSGTATLRLTHHSLAVGTGATGIAPFTAPTWASTLTGNWIINDGRLDVHRGQFLGGRPVILNGGHLEINEPVSNSNADSIIAGWSNNITVNGNATVAADDNAESSDPNTGDRAAVLLGSLTINNGSTMSHGSFSDMDIAYMGGATFNGTPTLNAVRGGVNSATIINGALTGSGFNMVAYNGNSSSVVLGGGSADNVANTHNGAITIYNGNLRLNKANGTTAITDGTAAEDIVINGGALLWGPGQHGDLTTTNNISLTNNGLVGIAATSPASIKTAGANQIADTANITLLTGTLGESDRFTNEKFGNLVMKNGTLNVGLGTMEMDTATFSGGALGFDRGGTLKIGKATYLPGSFDQSVFTGLPTPGAHTTLEIGAGGISLTGQNIVLGNGFSGNVAGSGGRLRLGGDLTFRGDDLIGGSYGRKGIFVQNGSSFRELGDSHVDLMGGTRDFGIDSEAIYTVTAKIANGGISKSGGGFLVLQPYVASTFTGPVIVNQGTVEAKGDGAFGTSAGGVTINSGGTVKLNSGWSFGDAFTVTGPGALVPGGLGVREVGALVAESGTIRLTGSVTIAGNATLAGNTFLDPSVAPGAGGVAYRIGTLRIEAAGGISGTGTVTLSGHGDGVVLNGINTTGNVVKDGAGVWSLRGAGTYAGSTTVTAGTLLVSHASALGAAVAGTTVLNGGKLAVSGGITLAEPLTINGSGVEAREGALDSVGGANTISSTVTLGSAATIRANEGTITLTAASSVSGTDTEVTLSGSGNGTVQGAIATGQGGLTKNGTGTWTLSGANTFLGTTVLNGGVLALDFTSNNASKLSQSADLNFGGGSLSILGNSTAGTVQFVTGTFLTGGGANVSVTSSGAQTASLSLGSINRFNGGTVNFNLPANGAILTSSAATDGILGSYATVNNTDWATVSGSAIAAFTGYTPLATAVPTSNAIITATTVTDGNVLNSLKITGGAGVTGVVTGMTLQSGGLLYTGSGTAGISGAGTLSGLTSADEFIVHTASGTLDIATSIIGGGSGSLTKDGPGRLVLSGTNAFFGAVNINDGTLSIVGPGGTTHPNALGSSAGPRNLNINGGTFEVVGGDYDSGATNMYYVIGSAGATIRSQLGAIVTINDSTGGTPFQLSGSGDLTFTGGGRYNLSGGAPNFPNFTGSVTVDGGILNVGNGGSTGFNPVGTGQNQTITLKSGSAIINQANFALGQNGLVNNIVAEGGVEFFAQGGNRVYSGDIRLAGTNSILLFERDTPSQERQLYFNGRVSGTGVTLNVYGANFGNPFYLASGSNPITGTVNLNDNAVLETRMPGSLGLEDGDLTVNLSGANSRLFLRHFQNGDFHANVNVNATAEINSARLVNFAGGTSHMLSINNLTSNTDGILTFGGSDAYSTHVAGTAMLTANTILNATSGNLLLDNGLAFSGTANKLEKRGGASVILHGPANNTGPTIIHQGFLILQNGGTLANTSGIELRGGELRVENSTVVNGNRLNDAAPITLGGGVLRLTGAETIGTTTAVAGTTQIINNPTSDTVPTALTLTGFTRELGAVVQFQQADYGAATGSGTFGQGRVSSRILIPGQADTTQTIPGFLGNNSLDFIQYDGTTIDNGVALGARDMRNPGSGAAFPTNYSDNAAETGWNDGIILRSTNGADNTLVTTLLTGNRSLDAIKIEAGGTNRDITIDLGTFGLRIEGGGILDVSATTHDTIITGTTGELTAGPAIPGTGTAELFLGGTNASTTINAIVGNNQTQAVAVVKTGTGTVSLNGNNTFTGGLYVSQGTLNTTNPNGLGTTPQNITLAGGTLQFNIANAGTVGDLGVPDHAITVRSNSLLILDNGALAGVDNDISLGSVTIPGPYTFGMRGFDSMDASFTGAHTFTGTPVLDMAQTGGNATSTFTFNGPIAGSGFYVTSSGNVNDATSVLQIGGGENTANTYAGKVTVLLPNSNGEDLRVELNKADGVTAITGDLEIQGGTVRNLASDQIADSSNLTITQGQYDANGKSETIASVTLRGGEFRTNSTNAAGTPVVRVTGDFNATGVDNTTGAGDGIGVNQNSTLLIDGMLRMNGYSRAVVGMTGANLIITGGLEMTGTTLQQLNGAGANVTRLLGDVTTFASTNVARLGNSTDSDTFTELAGDRAFNIADGPAGLDFSLSSVVRNSSSPALPGGIIKSGPGVMQIEGGGTGNSYSGATVVNQGTLVLFKSVGVNAIPAGPLTIGDGTGGARADQVIIRNSDQIADANEVTISSSGLLDLETFNTSETIASLSGSGNVDLGPNSVLTVNGGTTTAYAGAIRGAGSLVKSGSGVLALTGTSDIAGGTTLNGGGLIVNGSLSGAVLATIGTTLGGDGAIVGPVTVDPGATLAPDTLATGNLAMIGTLAADIVTIANYDSLNVTGTVVLGGDLSLSVGAGPFSSTDVFALIINDGVDPVSGEFTGLPEGSIITANGTLFQISYMGNVDGGAVGNDVILAVPEPGSVAMLLGGLAMLAGRRRRKES